MKRILEVLQGLLHEYERVCDLFVVTPEKHVGYRRAVALVEELMPVEVPVEDVATKGEE